MRIVFLCIKILPAITFRIIEEQINWKNSHTFSIIQDIWRESLDNVKRCKWCNLKNKLYIDYHDNEWGIQNFDDKYLFEMLILESFQAGLSWECVLNKRESFRKSYDNFDIDKIASYDENKVLELSNNEKIIRNKLKIQLEYGSFANYLKSFTKDKTVYENDKTHSNLSDAISKDLQKKGMSFVGTTIIYSYLQAIGVIYSHEKECFMYKE